MAVCKTYPFYQRVLIFKTECGTCIGRIVNNVLGIYARSPPCELRTWLLATYEAAYFLDIVKPNVPEVLQARWLMSLALSHPGVLGFIDSQYLRIIPDWEEDKNASKGKRSLTTLCIARWEDGHLLKALRHRDLRIFRNVDITD